MKIISKVSAIFLLLLLFCSCSKQDFLKYRMAIQDSIVSEEDRVVNNVTELIKQKDTDALIDMFSAHAVENGTSEIEENLKLLEEILGSEFETASFSGHSSGSTAPKYHYVRKTLEVTANSKLYCLRAEFVLHNEEDSEDVGLHRIILCAEEEYGKYNIEVQNDPDRQYGVYIDELIFEDENGSGEESQEEAVSELQTTEL